MSEETVYRLSGFSEGLDWRPIVFEEAFSAMRICSVCGVVPKTMALLPCCHPVCGSCLQGSAANGICSLDKKAYQLEFVQKLEFTEEQLNNLSVSQKWRAFIYLYKQLFDILNRLPSVQEL